MYFHFPLILQSLHQRSILFFQSECNAHGLIQGYSRRAAFIEYFLSVTLLLFGKIIWINEEISLSFRKYRRVGIVGHPFQMDVLKVLFLLFTIRIKYQAGICLYRFRKQTLWICIAFQLNSHFLLQAPEPPMSVYLYGS